MGVVGVLAWRLDDSQGLPSGAPCVERRPGEERVSVVEQELLRS
jgi:hypothetical protein